MEGVLGLCPSLDSWSLSTGIRFGLGLGIGHASARVWFKAYERTRAEQVQVRHCQWQTRYNSRAACVADP